MMCHYDSFHFSTLEKLVDAFFAGGGGGVWGSDKRLTHPTASKWL